MFNSYQSEDISIANEESLKTLVRTIKLSQGQFSLVLLRCNYAQLQQRIVEQLYQICPIKLNEIYLSTSVKTLYTTILENLGDEIPNALIVFGLDSVQDLDNLLTSANQVREEFRKEFAFPLLIWVNDQVLQKLIRLATDLENWATVIEFHNTTDELVSFLRTTSDNIFNGSFTPNSQVCSEVKAARQDLNSRQEELKPSDKASLQFILGYREFLHGEFDASLEYYQESLKFWQSSNNLERQGITLVYIAFVYERQAEENQADCLKFTAKTRNYFEQAIEIFEQAQRLDLVAQYITKICEVLRTLQAWDDLQMLAHKAIAIHRKYGNTLEIAQSYGFLAEVASQKLQWTEANRLAQQALKSLAENGEKHIYYRSLYRFILARSLQNLGNVQKAIITLERIRKQISPEFGLQLYISILETLRLLYFEQGEYLNAFQIKQEQISLEHQYGLRAFIGAAYLYPKRHCVKTGLLKSQQQAIIAQEIAASGRQKDVNNLIERISRNDHKLTIIHGQSGVGKSSILKAGLIPALKQQSIGERDVLPILVRIYSDWMGSFSRHCEENLDSVEAIVEKLRKNAEANLLTVLMFDQFEEFFFVYTNQRQRQPFYDFLRICLDIPYVKIILSLREDYLHYLLEFERSINLAAINNNILDKNIRYHLGRFSPKDAKAVVESLIEQAKFYLESQLIDELVKDLACEHGEISPIELQIVGSQIQAEKITTLEQYRQLGTKEKLVGRFLEQVIKDCGSENERCAQLILYLLTNENGTRPLKTRDELLTDLKVLDLKPDAEKLKLVLDILVGSGFVLKIRESPANCYQLVHDYLVSYIRQQQAPELLAALVAAQQKQKLTEEQLRLALQEKEKALRQEQQERKRAEIAEIEALVSLSRALFVTNDQLGAVVASLKAGVKLQETDVPDAIKQRAIERINQVITEVQERNRLEGHSNLVTSVSWSPNGKTIATACANRNIMLWNVDGALLHILQGHGDAVWSVCFSPNKDKIASASADRTIKIWSIDGTLLKTLKGHTDQVFSVGFSPSGNVLVSASADKTIKIWSIQGTLLKTLHGHSDQVLSVSYSPDGAMIASASADTTIKLWSAEVTYDKQSFLIKTLQGHTSTVNSVSFSPDRKTIVSASADNTIKIWSKSGQLIKTLTDHTASVNSIDISLDGKIVSGSSDNCVKLWSKNGQLIKTFCGHSGDVNSVCFSPDRNTIISGSADRTARIWSAKPAKPASLHLNELIKCAHEWVKDYMTTNPYV